MTRIRCQTGSEACVRFLTVGTTRRRFDTEGGIRIRCETGSGTSGQSEGPVIPDGSVKTR
ncbi:hypothetical protein H4V99_000730 [Cryobacterium sp. CG_9.6]|nr:hypothetical protein [Cryobacterium sp. CG_9.6]